MPKRLYQLVALMILIGAPVIANLASNAVPVVQSEPLSTHEAAPTQPAIAQVSASRPPPPPMTPSPDTMAQPVDAAVNPVAEVAPLLDPQGIEPAAAGEVTSVATQLSDAPPAEH